MGRLLGRYLYKQIDSKYFFHNHDPRKIVLQKYVLKACRILDYVSHIDDNKRREDKHGNDRFVGNTDIW
jgi:hypothetical protein